MSRENIEILRRALPDSAPANMEALFSILDEHVEWDYVGAFPEIQTARGPAQVREFLRGWSEAFDEFGFQAEEAIDAGDGVVALLRQWGRGKETGAEVESRTWQLFTFRDGKVVHLRRHAPASRCKRASLPRIPKRPPGTTTGSAAQLRADASLPMRGAPSMVGAESAACA
jgi:ketosteroid isomerase-like protein